MPQTTNLNFDDKYGPATGGGALMGKTVRRRSDAPANLIKCSHAKCVAEFFHVPARQFPTLCIGHSNEADRAANGWTPQNSVN